MSLDIQCGQVQSEELAEKYVAGRLSEDQRDAYELHYFGCSRCFEELERLREIQQALALRPAAALDPAPPKPARAAWRLWAAGLVAAGALLGAWLWTRPAARPDLAATPPPAAVQSADALEQLARLDPPRYRPSLLRGPEDTSAADFRSAMELYQKGDYAAAIPALSKASPQRLEATFFLAACYLLTGNAPSADDAARRVIAAGDTPYREEAGVILAKALLARNDVAGAARELEAVIALNGDLRAQAADLLASVKALHADRR